jgi:hypothetical protein
LSKFFFSLVLLLSQWWTPPLRLQVSDFSTFLMMCNVTSKAVFLEELVSVVRYWFHTFLKHLLTMPVAPSIKVMTTYFMFHIRWNSISRCLHFNLYSAYCYYYMKLNIQKPRNLYWTP